MMSSTGFPQSDSEDSFRGSSSRLPGATISIFQTGNWILVGFSKKEKKERKSNPHYKVPAPKTSGLLTRCCQRFNAHTFTSNKLINKRRVNLL